MKLLRRREEDDDDAISMDVGEQQIKYTDDVGAEANNVDQNSMLDYDLSSSDGGEENSPVKRKLE